MNTNNKIMAYAATARNTASKDHIDVLVAINRAMIETTSRFKIRKDAIEALNSFSTIYPQLERARYLLDTDSPKAGEYVSSLKEQYPRLFE